MAMLRVPQFRKQWSVVTIAAVAPPINYAVAKRFARKPNRLRCIGLPVFVRRTWERAKIDNVRLGHEYGPLPTQILGSEVDNRKQRRKLDLIGQMFLSPRVATTIVRCRPHPFLAIRNRSQPLAVLCAPALYCAGNALARLIVKANARLMGNQRLPTNGNKSHVQPRKNHPLKNRPRPHRPVALDCLSKDRRRDVPAAIADQRQWRGLERNRNQPLGFQSSGLSRGLDY